ncbi:MAG: PQQ-binding-like beta-propeller repeat protein [Planctomycetota bacterium]|nr:PQQ-binding-like beta-propeller repeat protein [Planctomycetota bacterium]
MSRPSIPSLLMLMLMLIAQSLSADEQKPFDEVRAAKPAKVPAKAPAPPGQAVKAQPVQVVLQVTPATQPTPAAALPIVGLVSADRLIRVKLSRGQDLVQRGEVAAALPLLQSALECPTDSAFAADGLERTVLRSIRREAERLIGRLPAVDRATYELLFGPDANEALLRARDRSDIAALEQVSLRYFHTRAGRDATYLLAAAYFDLGRPLDAGVWFDRLNQGHPDAEKNRNAIALQSAVAWSLSGMPELTANHLSDLWRWNPQGTMQLGGRTLDLFKDDSPSAMKWLRSLSGEQSHKRPLRDMGWPLVGGNAARVATSHTTQPGSQAVWKAVTSAWKVRVVDAPFSRGVINVARQIEGIEQGFSKVKQPAIPAVHPLIVDDVVLVKTLSQLQAFDLKSGEIKWQTNEVNELEQVRNGKVIPLPGDSGSILDPMLKDRVFSNSTHGTMSSNGGMVYNVTGLGFLAQNPNINVFRGGNTQPTHPLSVKPFNRLAAYDVPSGQQKWRVGGASDTNSDPLSNRYFLGPPLPLAGQLYCLTEQKQQVELVVLDATTGKLDWLRPLQSFAISVTGDANRATAGLSPSYANGLLICPTGSGIVVALDLATRELVWSYRYREVDDGDPRRQMRMIAMARMAAQRRGETIPKEQPGQWLDSYAIVTGNRVLVTPRDCDDLLCLDLNEGNLLWKLPRDDRAIIAGVHGEHVVVIGAQRIELFNLTDGQSAWEKCPTIPLPSGRCVLSGNRLCVPLSTGRIATLDLATREMKFEKLGFAPGNLVAANGSVITQGSSFVARLGTGANSPD